MKGERKVVQSWPAAFAVRMAYVVKSHFRLEVAGGFSCIGGHLSALRVADGRRGIHDGEDALRRRHGHDAVVIQLHQFPQRPEDLDAQHQHDEQGSQFQVSIGHAHGAPAQRHRRAAGDPEDGHGASGGVGGQDAHGGSEQFAGPLRQQLAADAALAEGLQRGQALHGVQEVRPQSAVGVAAGHAALAVPAMEQIGDDQRQ